MQEVDSKEVHLFVMHLMVQVELEQMLSYYHMHTLTLALKV